jgi:16S rRNA processing protein RimM
VAGGEPRQVTVGVVRKPFGLHGEVFVHPDPDVGDEFPVGARYRVAGRDAVTVRESWLHKGLRVVRFDGVEDRDAAAALRDVVLSREASADDLDEDAYWADDLVGRPVVDPGGRRLGTLAGVADGTAHDYLVLTATDGREVLVPAVEELVTVERDRLVVRPVPGLLDLDQADEA